jgi:single-strand DNA-binding protein
MDANNLVVLRGSITREPVVRDLPSGGSVTQLELNTIVGGRSTSVPVAVHDRSVTVAVGDQVVVVGQVQRRFFRVGGVTQSRTEVIAARVVKATRRSAVDRLIDDVAAVVRSG